MSGFPTAQELCDRASLLERASGGVFSLNVFRPQDVPALLAAAHAGLPEALMMLPAVTQTLNIIKGASRKAPALCACCPRPLFAGRYSVAVVKASRDDSKDGLSFAICRKCATEAPDILSKALDALRKIWPDARGIQISDTAGHA